MEYSWHLIIDAYKDTDTFNPFILAKYFNIEVNFLNPELIKQVYGISCLGDNIIFLNNELSDQKLMFTLAHEIIHTLNDTDSYHSNIESICEKQANKGAIKLLVHFYFEIFSKETFTDIFTVMNSFGIPLHLENETRKQIYKYWNGEYSLSNVGYSSGAV